MDLQYKSHFFSHQYTNIYEQVLLFFLISTNEPEYIVDGESDAKCGVRRSGGNEN